MQSSTSGFESRPVAVSPSSWSRAVLCWSLNCVADLAVGEHADDGGEAGEDHERQRRGAAGQPPADRDRLYAENVARAADRMEEPGLAIRFQLPSQVGDEHLDRVRHRERVIAPDLVEQALAGDRRSARCASGTRAARTRAGSARRGARRACTSCVSGLSLRSPTVSVAWPRGGRRRSSARSRASSSWRSNGLTR